MHVGGSPLSHQSLKMRVQTRNLRTPISQIEDESEESESDENLEKLAIRNVVKDILHHSENVDRLSQDILIVMILNITVQFKIYNSWTP